MTEEQRPGASPTPDPKSKSGEPAQNSAGEDGEIRAIQEIVSALKPLNEIQRHRALDYVNRRFGIHDAKVDALPELISKSLQGSADRAAIQPQVPASDSIQDIRSLKEIKQPRSGIQMAVLVAYYVSERAPDNERKEDITKADVERYFKMAGFKLPADAAFTLNNAKNAGYLDNTSPGHYRLNPVGYNLVAHRMGGDDSDRSKGARKSNDRRRRTKKPSRNRK